MKKVLSLLIIFLSIFIWNKVYAYKSYKIGDKVTYNEIDFYVIKDSSSDEDYVTMLKKEPLTTEEINNSLSNTDFDIEVTDVQGYGKIAYYESANCYYDSFTAYVNGNECYIDYRSSNVAKVLNEYKKNIQKNGYIRDIRLITYEELFNDLGYNNATAESSNYKANTDYVPSWLYSDKYNYWTMSIADDERYRLWIISDEYLKQELLVLENFIRPVVQISKKAIDNDYNSEESEKDNSDTESHNDIKDKSDIENNNIITNKNTEEVVRNDKIDEVKVPNTLKSVSGLILLIGLVLVCVGLNIFIIVKNRSHK